MDVLKDRRIVLAAGAAVALVGGLSVAAVIAMGQNAQEGPPPASVGGLMVQPGRVEAQPLDPARPLRCFVDGKLAGEMPVSECAKRNGVATGALDVGVDSSGGLSAAKNPTAEAPPPPPAFTEKANVGPDEASDEPSAGDEAAPVARACWEYSGGAWQRGPDATLNECVQQLFAGQCVRPGGAAYGRWGQKTVRLVLGRVEIGGDAGDFHVLARQQPGCAISPVG